LFGLTESTVSGGALYQGPWRLTSRPVAPDIKHRRASADRKGMQPLVIGPGGLGEPSQDLESRDAGKVLPVFIPASFVEIAEWPGPYTILRAPGVALVWAIPLPGDTLRYVLHEKQRQWEAQGIDWKARALQNLRELSGEPLGTGALFRENGETWLISLMYPDGLGPSRLLLAAELEQLFPQGYRVALPECDRAFAFARDLDPEDSDTVENLVERSYSGSGRPLSRTIMEPVDLLGATI
jgi:hypothetical protein